MIRYLPIFSLFLSLQVVGQTDVYSPEASRSYAMHLIEAGKHERAVKELERLHFLSGLSPQEIEAGMRSALCAEKYDVGLRFYALTTLSGMTSENAIKASYADLLLYDRQLHRYTEDFPSDSLSVRRLHYHVLNDDWELYEATLSGLQRHDHELDPFYQHILQRHSAMRFKSPFLAASLSTVVPGTGKLYTGEWKDGLFSMLAIGIIGWQTYRIFQRDGKASVIGWGGVALGGVFYLSNIYGSARSATNVNQRKYQSLHEAMDRHRIPCPD